MLLSKDYIQCLNSLKMEYIYKNKDINGLANDLFEQYKEYCITARKINSFNQNTKFYAKLREVGINIYTSGGYNKIKFSHADLEIIADRFNWKHAYDEVPEEYKKLDKKEVKEEQLSNYALTLIRQKDDEIKRLTEMINQLKKPEPMPELESEPEIVVEPISEPEIPKRVFKKVIKKIIKRKVVKPQGPIEMGKAKETINECIDECVDDLLQNQF